MKYGIYFAYWTHEWFADYKKYIDKMAKLGFDILEISCAAFAHTYTTDEQLVEIRDYAKNAGVILTAGYGPKKEENISSANEATVKHSLEFFKETFRKLELMDIHLLGGGLYSYWPVDFSESIDKPADRARSIKGVKELAAMAEQRGITLGLEALNRFEGYLINTCREALDFVNEVNSPNVKVMLDTFHMNIEEDNLAEAIRLAGSKLGHLHIGEQNRKVPGKGSIPWHEIGFALRDIGYDGAVVMEPFVLSGGTIGSDIKVWRDLVPNPTEEILDAHAKGALQYVKHVFEG